MKGTFVRTRLLAFVAIAVLVLGYIGLRYVGLDQLFRPSYTVHLQLSDSGGIFTGAEVDQRGIQVGSVGALHVTRTGVEVDLDLDSGVRVPRDVRAQVSDGSALGEQFVQLLPARAGPPYLRAGGQIPLRYSSIPVPPQTLLANLDRLAKSVPRGALTTTLTELAAAFDKAGPDLGRLIDSTHELTQSALADLHTTISLLDDSRTVLDTQVASSADIATFSQHLSSLVAAVRRLDPQLAKLFGNGIAASTEVTDLLDDTQQALPVLLDNLLTVTDVADDRVPQIRKLLITFPHALEEGLTLVRPCDDYHPDGTPVAGSCHVDPKTGKPIYQAHFGVQLAPTPAVCTQGYGGTRKYLPNGSSASGSGASEKSGAAANRNAGCTASPYSGTPNVRGSQNAQDTGGSSTATPSSASSSGGDTQVAYNDPQTGATVSGSGDYFRIAGSQQAPPADLAQLMTMGLP